jgi:hypothetical protein
LITGTFAYVSDVRVTCGSSADIGFYIGSATDDTHGDGSVLKNCRVSSPLVAAFKIQADKVKIDDSCTGGEIADTSIGFWVLPDASGAIDKPRLKNCGSQGHSTAGFQIDSGVTNGVIESCSSGGGDGKWTDADDANVWSNFSYADKLYKEITLTAGGGVGGTGTKYNLFQVTGTIRVHDLMGHVTTVLAGTSSTINLELGATTQVDITDSSGGPDLDARIVGTVFVKDSITTDPLNVGEPDNVPVVLENANYRTPDVPVILIQEEAVDTYIQLILTTALASGSIHWHVHWEPLTDDGLLVLVP